MTIRSHRWRYGRLHYSIPGRSRAHFFYVTTIAVPAVFMLGYWLLMQLLGDFVVGVLLVFVLKDRELLAKHPYYGWNQNRHKFATWKSVDRR
jgi:hypothetical protein